MRSPLAVGEAVEVPLSGELRYGLEFARLAAALEFHRPRRQANAPAVLLVPGFMAGDRSLSALRGWLRRRGSWTAAAGMQLNVDCAERAVGRLELRLQRLAARCGRRVVVIGQSRGGELARVLAVRNPDALGTLVMLGSPVLDPLSVSPAVLGAVRGVARLGDIGVPRTFSNRCAEGECCSEFWEDLHTPLRGDVRAISVYSRSDAIVAWRACLDPCARHVEVDSSHSGMSVNLAVYRELAAILEEQGQ